MSLHCINCNAPLNGSVCDYCGRQVREITKVDEENEQLAAYHKQLKEKEDGDLGELLTHGFMPKTPEALLAAGLDMLPLIKTDDLSYDDTKAAVGRLSAITTRLKLEESTETIEKAIGEFEGIIAAYEREDRNLGIACGVILLGLVIAGIWAGVRLLG